MWLVPTGSIHFRQRQNFFRDGLLSAGGETFCCAGSPILFANAHFLRWRMRPQTADEEVELRWRYLLFVASGHLVCRQRKLRWRQCLLPVGTSHICVNSLNMGTTSTSPEPQQFF